MWFTIDTWYCFNTDKIDMITGFSDSVQIVTTGGEVVSFYCDNSTDKYKKLLHDIYGAFKENSSYNVVVNNTKIEYSTIDNKANTMKNIRVYSDSDQPIKVFSDEYHPIKTHHI